MNINEIVNLLSDEMGIELNEVDESMLQKGKHLEAAKVYHGDEEYGVVAFTNDDKGLKFCMYEGQYHGHTGVKSHRRRTVNKIRLVVERDRYSSELYRLDSYGSTSQGNIEFLGSLEYHSLKKNEVLYSEAESLCSELFSMEAEDLNDGCDAYGFKWALDV
jgi:hypothetical protein